MGAWTFVQPRFENLIGKKVGSNTPLSSPPPLPLTYRHTERHVLIPLFTQLVYCGRAEAATPATGIGKVHKREADEVVQAPFDV